MTKTTMHDGSIKSCAFCPGAQVSIDRFQTWPFG